MKHKLIKCMVTALLSITFFSCQNDDAGPQPGKDNPKIGEVTPVGEVRGARTTKEIGPNGGVISSESITVNIPDGALSANTIISIDPITSTNPAGVGQSFRLLPNGIKFNKPVTVTFSYAGTMKDIPLLEVLTISCQDKEGIWRISGDVHRDSAAKTISATTDHFGDWTQMKWLDLTPVKSELEFGKTLSLQVLRYIPIEDKDFLVFPVISKREKEIPVIKPVPLESNYILNWKLDGSGELKPNGNAAVLTAPEHGQNVVTNVAVSVEIRSSEATKRSLVSNITCLTDQYVKVRLGTGEWKYYFGKLLKYPQEYSIAAKEKESDNLYALHVNWKKGEGIHAWSHYTEEEDFVTFYYSDAYTSNHTLLHSYIDSNGYLKASGGTLNIPVIDKNGYTTGRFNLTSAGRWGKDGTYVTTETVEAEFKVKYTEN